MEIVEQYFEKDDDLIVLQNMNDYPPRIDYINEVNGNEMEMLKRYIYIILPSLRSSFKRFSFEAKIRIYLLFPQRNITIRFYRHPRKSIRKNILSGFADYSKRGNSASVFRATSSHRISWFRMASNKSYSCLPDFTGANRECSSIRPGGQRSIRYRQRCYRFWPTSIHA